MSAVLLYCYRSRGKERKSKEERLKIQKREGVYTEKALENILTIYGKQ